MTCRPTDGDWMRGAAAGTMRALLCAALMLAAGSAGAQEWAQFRGPGAAGVVADNPDLPERWSATENVAWRTPLPGLGWSSPIVAGGLVFLTTVASDGEVETPESGWYRFGERDVPADVHHWLVYALDLQTGEERWRREVHTGVPASSHHLKNTFASETPVTDGSGCTSFSATSASTPSASTARCSGRARCRRPRPATAGARRRRRCCTTAGSTWWSTTRSSPTSRR